MSSNSSQVIIAAHNCHIHHKSMNKRCGHFESESSRAREKTNHKFCSLVTLEQQKKEEEDKLKWVHFKIYLVRKHSSRCCIRNPTICSIIQWDNGMIDPLSDDAMFILIDWDKLVRQCVACTWP